MKKGDKILMCLSGIALVALGVLCIIYPGATLLSLAWLIALLFYLGGCSQMAFWARARKIIPHSGLVFLSALLQIILGCMMLFTPQPTMIVLPFIFAFWLLFEGVNLAITAVDIKRVGFRKWWVLFCIGLVAAAFGVCCLFYPNVSVETIAVLVGIGIILSGVGYWVRVALVNKVEKRFVGLADRIQAAIKEIENINA